MLKMALGPEEDGLQDVRSSLTFDLWCQYSERFYMYKCKNVRFFAIYLARCIFFGRFSADKNSATNPYIQIQLGL